MTNYILIVNDRVVHRPEKKPSNEQLYRWVRYYYPYPVTLAETVSVTNNPYGSVADDRASIEDIVCGR